MSIAALLPFAVLLLAMYGLGAVASVTLARWGTPRTDASWMDAGDTMVLGTVVFLGLSGWFLAVDHYSRTWLVIALVLGGGGIFLRWRGTRGSRPRWRPAIFVLVLGGVALVQLAAALARNDFNWCDDTSYLYLVERLRQTGGLIDPWNNRRLTSLGGQTVLQAAFLGGDRRTLFLAYDFVIGGVLLAAQVLGRGFPRVDMLLAGAAATVVAISSPHSVGELVNSCPRFITAALLLAAINWSARLSATRDADGPRLSAALGCLLAALATLRLPYVTIAGVTLASLVFVARGGGARLAARWAAVMAAAAALSIAGWCIAQQRSSGTWLFPLMSGNLNPDWPINGPPGSIPFIWRVWRASQWIELVGLPLAAAGTAILLIPNRRGISSRQWWCIVAPLVVAATLVTPMTFPLQAVSYASRFNGPIMLAFLIALPMAALSPAVGEPREQPGKPRWFSSFDRQGQLSAVIGTSAMLLLVIPVWLNSDLSSPDPGHDGFTPFGSSNVEPFDDYQTVREALPSNASVLAAVDFPQQLGFGWRAISALDLVDSTAPGRPPAVDASPVERMRWLGSMGITHVVAEMPSRSRCIFNDVAWFGNLVNPSGVWRYWTPYQLGWFRFIGAVQTAEGAKWFGKLLVVPVPVPR